jgi:LacI family transcriptional regulator
MEEHALVPRKNGTGTPRAGMTDMNTPRHLLPPPDAVPATVAGERAPLHARVREHLRAIALRDFADGERFYSEPFLIEHLGVSQGTVRHALADLAREGLLIRRVPAGTFVRKRGTEAGLVQVVMPGCGSVFLAGILERLLARCRQAGLPVRVHHTHEGESAAELLPRLETRLPRRGAILLGEDETTARAIHSELSRRGLRVVNIDTLADGCGDAYVGVDNETGIRLGLEHLLALGHRRIVLLVNEPMRAGNTRARVRAFESIARARGLDGEARVAFCPGIWKDPGATRKIGAALGPGPRPTAVFAVSDPGAWAVLKAFAELGVAVPAEVSVLGFDDDRASAFMQPPLSTLAQPIDAIAARAVALLTQKAAPGGAAFLPPALIVRESTARAPQETETDADKVQSAEPCDGKRKT